jgi:acyl-CoA synthetase (NDP forming)
MISELEDLEPLFHPRNIAVVGASSNKNSRGYEYVDALVKFEFPGPIYPVNPRIDEVLGLKAYPRLEDIPGDVDFVISAVPAAAVFDLVEGAKAKHTKLIHFFTARFSETGRADAAEAERELERKTKEAGIHVIGPNCMGVYYPKQRITFDTELRDEPGNIGFLSQSGSHAFRVAGRGRSRGLRFSKIISYGNALDLNEVDFLHHFAHDPDTEVIAAYIEGLRDGKRFFEALRYAAERKPVVVLKGGRTPAGHTAAASHTASLAGQQDIWRVAVKQAGALEVGSLNELIDMLVAFRSAGPARGFRAAVLGGAGGGTVEAADLCHEAGFELSPVPQSLREVMREKVPHAWDWVGNPIDGSIIGFSGNFNELNILQLMAADPTFDLVLINLTVERLLRRMGFKEIPPEYAEVVHRLGTDNEKAVAVVIDEPELRDPERLNAAVSARDIFGAAGVAVFPTVERAVKTLSAYVHYLKEREAMFA